MADKDKELEDLQRELNSTSPLSEGASRPFLHRPNQLDLGKGSLCFLDGSRRCGPDCTAFNAEEGLDDNGHEIDTPNKCLVLTYMGQQGAAALGIIALSRTSVKASQDKARIAAMGGNPEIPDPMKKGTS